MAQLFSLKLKISPIFSSAILKPLYNRVKTKTFNCDNKIKNLLTCFVIKAF